MDMKPTKIVHNDTDLLNTIHSRFSNVEKITKYFSKDLDVWKGRAKSDGEKCFIISVKVNSTVFVVSRDGINSYADFFFGIVTMATFWDSTPIKVIPFDVTDMEDLYNPDGSKH